MSATSFYTSVTHEECAWFHFILAPLFGKPQVLGDSSPQVIHLSPRVATKLITKLLT